MVTTQVDTLAFRTNAEALIRATQDHFCDGRCCYVCGPTVHWPCPPARANRVATEAIALLDELAAARVRLAQHEDVLEALRWHRDTGDYGGAATDILQRLEEGE